MSVVEVMYFFTVRFCENIFNHEEKPQEEEKTLKPHINKINVKNQMNEYNANLKSRSLKEVWTPYGNYIE